MGPAQSWRLHWFLFFFFFSFSSKTQPTTSSSKLLTLKFKITKIKKRKRHVSSTPPPITLFSLLSPPSTHKHQPVPLSEPEWRLGSPIRTRTRFGWSGKPLRPCWNSVREPLNSSMLPMHNTKNQKRRKKKKKTLTNRILPRPPIQKPIRQLLSLFSPFQVIYFKSLSVRVSVLGFSVLFVRIVRFEWRKLAFLCMIYVMNKQKASQSYVREKMRAYLINDCFWIFEVRQFFFLQNLDALFRYLLCRFLMKIKDLPS